MFYPLRRLVSVGAWGKTMWLPLVYVLLPRGMLAASSMENPLKMILTKKVIFTSDVKLLIFWSNLQQSDGDEPPGIFSFSRALSTRLTEFVPLGLQLWCSIPWAVPCSVGCCCISGCFKGHCGWVLALGSCFVKTCSLLISSWFSI